MSEVHPFHRNSLPAGPAYGGIPSSGAQPSTRPEPEIEEAPPLEDVTNPKHKEDDDPSTLVGDEVTDG